MLDDMIVNSIFQYIGGDWLHLVVIVLSFLLALEQWLAQTNRIKANSTLQLITDFVQLLLGKAKDKEDG